MNHDGATPTGLPARELPALRLSLPALEHNVRLMAEWCRKQKVELCPHIKTTMTRPIVDRQMAAGAWGVTVATVRQAEIALGWGLRRLIIANQVIHRSDLTVVRRWLDQDPELELYCFVDSSTGLDLARSAMDGVRNPLRVLIDVGAQGGRTGVRDIAAAYELGVDVAKASPGLLLAGVAGYEGIRPNRRDAATTADVDAHCRSAIEAFQKLTPVLQTERPLFSMGGSAFPDRVVHSLRELLEGTDGRPVVPVLRSGCYVTHDHGTYEHVSPLPGLRAALTVRTVVLSTPEPGRAVVGAGKRELPYDAGLPVLIGAHDAQGAPRPAAKATATQIFDHHLVLTDTHGLQVGDEVDLGISHPCSAFDRWPDLGVVDTEGRLLGVWHPQFR
ncbi:alanine racemase [Streptomyces sp. LHD-70]|uniref:alanine racemase n=1 Tax=Streptomyces sp. LHD-70 TaxID=3072140 RepID=UPI00280CC40C|nr:alanine racemase [Streptomyces sp. LHD-70]MDQ8703888.1 alanine racemase [Streptomyces sp. LHD-70]